MQSRNAIAAVILTFTAVLAPAQFAGSASVDGFHDKSMLKPPAGSKVAVIVFEDLGCPGCAAAHPIELQVAEKYHVPIVRYDFPLAAHVWTFDGAVCARYIEDTLKNPRLAGEYRTAVFAAQSTIGSKDDLRRFTQRWLQQHGQAMPFVIDPDGQLAAKVKADYDLGRKLNLVITPTIVVVTQSKYQVVSGVLPGESPKNDPKQLPAVVSGALAQTAPPARASR